MMKLKSHKWELNYKQGIMLLEMQLEEELAIRINRRKVQDKEKIISNLKYTPLVIDRKRI